MEPKSQELAVKNAASDRNFRQFAKTAVVLTIIFVIGSLSYITYSAVRSENQLRTIITDDHKATSQQLSYEEAQQKAAAAGLATAQGLLGKQDAYLTCLVSLFTNNTFVPTSQLASCKEPFTDATVTAPAQSSKSTTPTQSPVKSPSNSSTTQTTTPPASTTPAVPTVPTPPAPSNLVKGLNAIGNFFKGLF